MSWQNSETPDCKTQNACDAVETVIVPKAKNIGAFDVRRSLPSSKRRMVGPFVFLDQMGPATIEAGNGMDVRPHPHIGIATVTWLFKGAIMHRDSLGFVQEIKPGELNWMVAGSGIVHSERTPDRLRNESHPVYGIQAWVALPKVHEEIDASFAHYAASDLPKFAIGDAAVTLICGSAWDQSSPVELLHETLYAEVSLPAGVTVDLPEGTAEKAILLLSGKLSINGDTFDSEQLIVLKDNQHPSVKAEEDAHLMLLGGAPMDGPRHMWWNFVSSSAERIEQAKDDWREGKFGSVPGDDEFIPLPD